ncbi:DNA-binding transcriptional regulator, LysR family [Tistlia consotensis]|uniref:DNA-binding transcriptional regulator, LysR family n=2 Tax=Tistlia TaxID=1321364 RepID=A0A1Y6BVT7_9PROT|nr:DNA-binding transcriptional regulator, LysR family [Tistlia consotensis USBA 355]SNS19309.1 DNA-binding transcriptional regulator, LysR family [Tistlia consotensis]
MRARQLEVFCMLMRCGTVTSAAAMLNISQPALSQILLHAEDQLGFKLFNRVRGRLIPTQEAEELYPEAERIFSELGALRRRTVDMRHGRTGLVRIAASAPPGMTIVPKALVAFREAHSDVVVRSLIAPMLNIIDMLRNGDVSLGVVMNNLPHHDIDVETVGHAELVCLMPEGHRLTALKSVGFADLVDEPMISYRADTLPARLLAGAAEAENFQYAPAIEIDISITAMPFVHDGLGVALVDGLLPWQQFPGVVSRPLRPYTTVPIAILTRSDTQLSGSHQIMRDCIREVCATLERGRRERS